MVFDLTEYEVRYLRITLIKAINQTSVGKTISDDIVKKLEEELEQIKLLKEEI